LPPQGWGRGLPLDVATAYSGIPHRRLWALIREGQLPTVRIPGMRAVLLLRGDLDALLEKFRDRGDLDRLIDGSRTPTGRPS